MSAPKHRNCRHNKLFRGGILIYHYYCKHEPLEKSISLQNQIYHTHPDCPNFNRSFPQRSDSKTVLSWSRKLKKIDYNDRLSQECSFTSNDRQELKIAREILGIFNQ